MFLKLIDDVLSSLLLNKKEEVSMIKKLSAEFVGTLWLVLGGCGSAVLAAAFPNVGIGLPGVSLAFGLTVLFRFESG